MYASPGPSRWGLEHALSALSVHLRLAWQIHHRGGESDGRLNGAVATNSARQARLMLVVDNDGRILIDANRAVRDAAQSR